ncbi:hypothetical protein KLA_06847 [Cellulophaga geojensis KL-A]|uniref:ATP-grasp domain-containing protein n=1 Tax=Cellulophaga geojensis KL-A TaxID=1328323 RepID=A0ABN0RQ74_9FLAO|nr:hypothetical protein [Cellulophaga geojensis]EWH14027.1 hypothetical protein KLA_06847 [Cellulophaga geojensis KL-A]
MKIGIQPTPIGFTKHWIEYCKNHSIDYKLVDCYKSDIIKQLNDCDVFMWHHDLLLRKDNIIAKRLLFALEQSNKIVFPTFNEGWHYDDKIGQKYLLEALKVPFIPTFIFYDKTEALNWANQTTYPKVFKLKGGAGSANVCLVNSEKDAIKKINKAFSSGFNSIPKKYFLNENIRKYKSKKISVISLLKNYIRYILPINKNFINHKEKGYIYFQEFIPNNNSDLRIVVINQNKIFGIKRYNRANDFRASGSGVIEYLDENNMPVECIKIALNTAKKLRMDSIAYDFVFDTNEKPVIIEITFAFGSKVSNAKGYWDENLVWHNKEIKMQEWMIKNVIKKVDNLKSS